jgi:manganese/zinc/iron transport system permease protein
VSLGYPVHRLEFFLTLLLVLAIVVGLQTVGVVLMSALVIAPAVAARQWTKTLGSMVVVSAVFGGISSVCGVFVSSVVPKLPTGPMIVLVASGWVVMSLFFAPSRGLAWAQWRHFKQRRTMKEDRILLNFLSCSETQEDPCFAHDISVWESLGESAELFLLQKLENEGFVYSRESGVWGLTALGVQRAKKMAQIGSAG